MRNPLATPAALLLNESLLITRPAARLRSGWLGMSVGLHLLAGAAVFVAPLFQTEKLAPPQLRTDFVIPVILGGYTPPPPKGDPHGRDKQPANDKPDIVKKDIKAPTFIPLSPQQPEIVNANKDSQESDVSNNPFGDPKGKPGGTGKIGDVEIGDPTQPAGPGGPGIPVGVETIRSYDLVDQPVLLSHVEPSYPEQARSQGITGTVILEVIVDENGQVVSARVTRSDNVMFDTPAIAAVKRWKYSIPRAGGRAVRIYKSVTMRFILS